MDGNAKFSQAHFNIKIGDCLGHLQTSIEFICVKQNQLNQYLSTVAIFEGPNH